MINVFGRIGGVYAEPNPGRIGSHAIHMQGTNQYSVIGGVSGPY